jgi:hypothetical protein
MVILHQTKSTVLLLNKEDWGGHWQFGRADLARLEVFFEKHIKFLLFQGREWVDLAAFGCGVCYEFDSVIPQFGFGQIIEGLFGEDRLEIMEVGGICFS